MKTRMGPHFVMNAANPWVGLRLMQPRPSLRRVQPLSRHPQRAGAPAHTSPPCGPTNPAGEAFCSNCGVSLLGAPAPAAVSQAPVVDQSQPAVADQAQQPVATAVGAPSALQARLIVEADNQEFDLS